MTSQYESLLPDTATSIPLTDIESWDWDDCIVCGEPSEYRGLSIHMDGDRAAVLSRIGWCTRPMCEEDRAATGQKYVLLQTGYQDPDTDSKTP